ncbi:MAG: ATP-binding protein [Nitrospinaceae bacterium]
MARKRLLWQLYPTYLIITLAALTAVGWYALNTLRDFYYSQIKADLEARAHLVEPQVADIFNTRDAAAADALSKKLGNKVSMRLTLIDPSGQVLGDSHEDPARMDNHAGRPEVHDALMGSSTGTSIRFSHTLNEKMMYLALPVRGGDRIAGVVRTSLPVTFIDRQLRSIEVRIALGGLVIALLAAGISLKVSRRITRPLEDMKQVAEQFARGNLAQKVHVSDSVEIGGLAEGLNQMARQLDERIRTITAERNQREAVLLSMVEGVLAVDAGERIISMNQAAADFMGVDRDASHGRSIQEVVRNSDLQQFVKKTLAGREVVEADVILNHVEERYLQARGTVLKDGNDRGIGAVVVLNDVTRLRRLENVRRDFVANVSHELKTPITSIKGSVETLLEGAIRQPEDAQRFLEIIARQVDRLNAIIEDLLSLSRLEQDPEKSGIQLEDAELKPLLQTVLQDCAVKASEQNIQVVLICDDGLRAKINPALLEQAVVNLVDNAIKYGGPEKKVEVEAARNPSEIIIRVRDRGSGIEKLHLPRLFERFYRIDQARSRKLGGTGLGLGIVKHIAQVHGGSVQVESSLGQGSVFSIHLPHPPRGRE